MKFGVREICDVVFKAKAKQTLGNKTFFKNEPVLYFDSLKTSTLEGAATTVYATGGRGYSRLIAWEGERTLTFTMEDALLSAEGFAILSGAGLINASEVKPMYVHQTSTQEVKVSDTDKKATITLEGVKNIAWKEEISGGVTYTDEDKKVHQIHINDGADIFCLKLDANGDTASEPCVPVSVEIVGENAVITCDLRDEAKDGDIILVDYYVVETSIGSQQIEITADKFAGNYYVEASTLFRREQDGVDLPAEFVIPNAKVQSNFSFAMASSGDPSTFTFTLDAFPDYTKFDKTKKVLAALQIIDDSDEEENEARGKCDGIPAYKEGDTEKNKNDYAVIPGANQGE